MRPKQQHTSKPPLFKKTNTLLGKTNQQPFFNSIHNKAPTHTITSQKIARPSTTAIGTRGIKNRRTPSIHRPDTAPSGARGGPTRSSSKNEVDDKTQISVLKSDIVLLHQKLNQHLQMDAASGAELETTLAAFQYKAGCLSQNSATKLSLVDLLFEKMMALQKGLLDETSEHANTSITARIKAKQSHDSNLSKLSNYFQFVDHVMHMHERLKNKKKKPSQMPSIHQPSVVTMLAPNKPVASTIKRKSPSKYKDELRRLKKESTADTKKWKAKVKQLDAQRVAQDALVDSLKSKMKELHTTHALELTTLNDRLEQAMKQPAKEKIVTKVDTTAVDALSSQLAREQQRALEKQRALENRLKTMEASLNKEKQALQVSLDEHRLLQANDQGQLEQVLSELAASKKQLKDQAASYEAKLAALTSERDELLQNATEHSQTLHAYQKRIERLKEIEVLYHSMKPEMERLLNAQSSEEEESLKRLASMQAYLEKMEKAYADLQKEANGLRDRLAAAEQSDRLYASAMEELRVEREQRVELEKKAAMVDRVKRLNEKVMKAEALLRDRDDSLSSLSTKLSNEQTLSAKLKRDVRRLLDDVEAKDAQIKRLEEIQKQVARDALASLTTQQPASIKNNDALIDEIRALREAFQAKLRAASAQVEQLKHAHASQLLSIQTAVSQERALHASKLSSLQQRCALLTTRVQEAISF